MEKAYSTGLVLITLLSRISVLSILKITGLKTERVFMDYIKATQLGNAIVVAKHPFLGKCLHCKSDEICLDTKTIHYPRQPLVLKYLKLVMKNPAMKVIWRIRIEW